MAITCAWATSCCVSSSAGDVTDAPKPLEFVISGATDVGQVREHNEDHFLVGDLDEGKLVDVAVKNPDGQQAVQKRAFQYDARYRS